MASEAVVRTYKALTLSKPGVVSDRQRATASRQDEVLSGYGREI